MKRGAFALSLLPILLLLSSCGSSSPAPVIDITPTGATLNVNTQQQFTATIFNLSSTLVNWEVNGTIGGSSTYGTITTGGLYTAPAAVPAGSLNVVTITAIAQAQTSLTTTADVTIVPAAAITISPTSAVVPAGTSYSFLASVGSSAQNTAVNWSVNNVPLGNSTVGTISGGNYTAPLVPPPGGTVKITATEANDTTQTVSATVTITLGTATMQGAYTFSVSGTSPTGPFARAGYFYTGVNGTLTGVEDLNFPGVTPYSTQFSGLYSIGSDGRGTMSFCEGSASNCTPAQVTSNYRILVLSTQQVKIIAYDTGAVGSGEADLQSNLNFGSGDLSGCYTVDFSGASSITTPESAVGYFCSNGSGGIVASGASTKTGELDVNVGGSVTNVTLTNSTYTLGGNNRGTMTLTPGTGTPLHFTFYMVSPSQAKFVETDASPILSGDAVTQQTPVPALWSNASLNAPIVFKLLGTGSSGGITDVGRLLPDGSGNIASGSTLDENYSGNLASAGVQGGYSIDQFGRGTMTLTNVGTFIFYMVSPNSAVFDRFATGLVEHGTLVPQTSAAYSATTLSGNSYGFNLSGDLVANSVKENIVGQLTSNQAGAFPSGTMDINDLGTLSPGQAISAATANISATSGRGTMSINASLNYVIYFVSPTQVFMMEIDPGHLDVGSLVDIY